MKSSKKGGIDPTDPTENLNIWLVPGIRDEEIALRICAISRWKPADGWSRYAHPIFLERSV